MPTRRIPYFFSDQYDVGMEYSGYAPDWDQVVFRGSGHREFIAFWLKAGRLAAGMAVNTWDMAIRSRRCVAAQNPWTSAGSVTRTSSWRRWRRDGAGRAD